ncbi:tRNA/tmRNA (uracil-C(5))-methyltransferase [Cellvibrio zantedeschiae]|uniref:tRNA/tmRNA (uracil-C(5))-methyltransferase n=1 Tax=Cellvibrio zantedeschiae TaxID=1237077 RepID=A0ABQ3B0B6_9GAMM|nr:tRNA (uridine(54)-C5)-methyltransferase TrmA [Cellvibrio zantedeschiae]GGY70010.1 tRNA/tmRNA (uracil-C(5))-methyltransferase [Cellvibrio zantedeschiae]
MNSRQYTQVEYQAQLAEKIAIFKHDFAEFSFPEPVIFESAEKHFRMRAEFRIWHKGPVSTYCMFTDDEFKRAYDISEFPIGSALMNRLMTELMTEINANEILRTKLFQIDFLTTLSGQALISLIYHRKLDDEWISAARDIQTKLNIFIIGRSKGQKIVVEQDFVIEQLNVCGKQFRYQQIESGFTQPNAGVCEKMLTWAVEKSRNWGGDLIELYCGNGNFTLPLSQNFNRVLATELAKPSVKSALYNMELNQVNNVSIARLSSEDFSQAMDKVRSFNRLEGIDLDSYTFSSIFVDPPRSGMDPHTTSITQRYDNIMYISCNPATLRENLKTIVQTHDITNVALFDQFPYTHHLEVGVTLRKRAK